MASSDFWQRLSSSLALSAEWESGVSGGPTRSTRGTVKLWVFLDVLTVLIAAAVATIFNFHATAIDDVRGIWHGTLIYGRSMWTLLALVCGFAFTLVVTSRRMHLYTPARLTNFLHEQRLSAQACFTSGLLLTGTLYLVHGHDIPRSIVITTVLLVTVALGTRRLVYRVLLYRRFDRHSNPVVQEVIESHRELFCRWTEADFDELHSRVGAGGALTAEGTLAAVRQMNRKRELFEKLDLLLETSQADVVARIVELFYEQATAQPARERTLMSNMRIANDLLRRFLKYFWAWGKVIRP